jgi:hypothetical protein
VKRLAQLLVAELILLAPWGGPCDRFARAADPTTAAGVWLAFPNDSIALTDFDRLCDSGPLGALRDILLEEEECEDQEGEGLTAVWPLPGMLSAGSSWAGQSAPASHSSAGIGRCPILRC